MTQFIEQAKPGFPYWWENMTWPDLSGQPPKSVDLLIIGAGYTGLSAARAAHDAGARVAVIDADQPGQGASTRNGGMVGAHPRLSWEDLNTKFGKAAADALFDEAAPALEWVKSLIRDEDIDCDFAQSGRIQLAWSKAHFENQKRVAKAAESHGVTCQVLSKDEIQNEIATPCYHGGILFPEHGSLQPARYFQGMLDAVLKRDVPVIAHCPAQRVERSGSGFTVATPKGQIRADKLVLATNGYTRKPFQWFARRVFALPSFLIATEPLSSNLIQKLAPGRRMMVETRARHSYFRVSPDGTRLIYGGRAAMVDVDLTKAAKRLMDTMCQVWPELEGTRLSHVWTGNTGYSFDHMPHVGEHDGIHYAMGFSGSGTVMAPYLGAKAAYQALGDPRGETAYSSTRLAPRWFHPGGRPLFLQAANVWYREWVDRADNRAARR